MPMNEMVIINILLVSYLVVIFLMSYYSYREAAALKHFMVSDVYKMQLQKIIRSQIRDMVICSILFVLNIVCMGVLW